MKVGKNVGQNITDRADGLRKDILIKRAKFIDRNNTLRQEFHFAHPDTLLRLNQAYNSDFTGSSVWNLFCREQEMLENTYSSAVRLMMGLPRETHRYFIEPLTGWSHVKADIIKRFITFLEQIKKSKKQTLIYVLQKIYRDVRSVTGSNLHNIMLRCGKTKVDDLVPSDGKVVFKDIPNGQDWRIHAVQELVKVQNYQLEISGFNSEEVQTMLTWICTSGPS